MKRFFATAITLLAFYNIYAALPAATDPTIVNAPEAKFVAGWSVGVSGFYLQPSSSNGDEVYASIFSPLFPFQGELKQVDPSYDWGFSGNLRYIFPDSSNDFYAEYFHFSSDDKDSFVVNPLTNAIIPFPYHDPNSFDTAEGRTEYDLDRGDVTFGQYINVGCRLRLHPNVGVQIVDLERSFKTGYTQSTGFQAFIFNHAQSDFTGYGPMVGVDSSYYIGYGFGVVGHFNSALLYSNNVEAKLDVFNQVNLLGTPIKAITLRKDEDSQIAYSVDGKLGLDYTYVINPCLNDSNLTLEVGYYVSHYFNVIDAIDARETTVSPIIDNIIVTSRTADFGLQGPYISLTYHA